MKRRWTPERIAALRAMYAEFERLVQVGGLAAFEEIAVKATELAITVPDLLDEICRLQAERQDGGRPRVVKFDSAGGRA